MKQQIIVLETISLLSVILCSCSKQQQTTKDSSNSSSNQQTTENNWQVRNKKINQLRKISIVRILNSNGYNKNLNQYNFTTNDQGIFNLQLQGKQNGKIKIYIDPKDKQQNILDFKTQIINIKKGQIITIPLTLKMGDSVTSTFYIKNVQNDGQQTIILAPSKVVSEYSSNANNKKKNNYNNPTNQIKNSLNNIDKVPYGIASIQTLGFDNTGISGGLIVVNLVYYKEESSPIVVNDAIYAVCNALKNNNIGTGINIRINEQLKNQNGFVYVGSCYVSPLQIKNVNDTNVPNAVSNYVNLQQ